MSRGLVNKSTGERIPSAPGYIVDKVGDLSALHTTAKDKAVSAINEVADAVSAIDDGTSIDSFADVETALAGKADLTDLAPAFSTATAYAVGQYVSYEGNIYKCTSAHSAGAWVAGDFTLVAVGSELSAINSNISTLESGLTNVDVALSVPDGSGKNQLPMTLANLKARNTIGTWVDNVYTLGNVSCTVNTDSTGAVTSLQTTAASTGEKNFVLYVDVPLKKGCYILSSGFSETYRYKDTLLTVSGGTVIARGNSEAPGQSFTLENAVNATLTLRIKVDEDVTAYPMIRPATITDPTFAPYIPSVESRIEVVESRIINVRRVTSTTTAFGDVSKPSDIAFNNIVGIYVDGYMKYAVRTNDSIKIYQMNNSSLTADSAKVVAETEVTLVIMYVN